MEASPNRFVFNRSNRIPQFIRAAIVVALGVGIFVLAARLSENLIPVVRCLGGGVIVTGGIALIMLLVLLSHDVTQVIETDGEGLTIKREGDKPLTRTVKWEEVAFYEVEEGRAPILTVDEATTPSSTMTSGSDDLFGCLFGIVLAAYLGIMQWFIGGGAWTVRFKLAGKRNRVSFSGYGRQMGQLVEQILPLHLPDKLTKPKAQTETKSTET